MISITMMLLGGGAKEMEARTTSLWSRLPSRPPPTSWKTWKRGSSINCPCILSSCGIAFCVSRESRCIKFSKNQIVLFLSFFYYSRSDLSRLAPALEDSAFSYGFHSEELVHLADYWLREWVYFRVFFKSSSPKVTKYQKDELGQSTVMSPRPRSNFQCLVINGEGQLK